MLLSRLNTSDVGVTCFWLLFFCLFRVFCLLLFIEVTWGMDYLINPGVLGVHVHCFPYPHVKY